MNTESRYRRQDDLLETEVDGEAVSFRHPAEKLDSGLDLESLHQGTRIKERRAAMFR